MTSWLPCFGRDDGQQGSQSREREPLLPQTSRDYQEPFLRHHDYASTTHKTQPQAHPAPNSNASTSPTHPDSLDGLISKLVRSLAAINAGKLPSQQQLNKILRWILNSELLQVKDSDVRAATGGPNAAPPRDRHGKRGRHSLGSEAKEFVMALREALEALLQFGMEKNDDDKFQHICAEIINFESDAKTSSSFTCDPETPDASTASSSSRAPSTPRPRRPSNPPMRSTSDVQTLLLSLNVLVHTFMSSHPLRGAALDLSSLIRDATVHIAEDIRRAAEEVEKVAVGEVPAQDESRSGGDATADVAEKRVVDVLKTAQEDAREIVDEIKKDWSELGDEMPGQVRQVTLARIREILEQIQRNSASRSAMRSILTLGKKYAQDVIDKADKARNLASQVENGEAGGVQTQDPADTAIPNYHPDPYGLKRTTRPAGDTPSAPMRHSDDKAPQTEPVLRDLKSLCERVAGNCSLDPLLSALDQVIKDVCIVPVVVGESIDERVEAKVASSRDHAGEENADSDGHDGVEGGARGKKKKRKGKGKKKDSTPGGVVSMTGSNSSSTPSPLTPSPSQESQLTAKTGHDGGSEVDMGDLSKVGGRDWKGKGKVEDSQQDRQANTDTDQASTLREYFGRLGEFLEKALGECGWIGTQDGKETLEGLFDDGVHLLRAFEEEIAEVEDEVKQETGDPMADRTMKAVSKHSMDETTRKRFHQDIHHLLQEFAKYIEAIERDKTTMRLVRAGTRMEETFMTLVSHGRGLQQRLRRWTNWIGWIVPRLLRSLPDDMIPIPSIEIKSGNLEGGLYALFVKALAEGSKDVPVETKLCPDQVVVREWTEVRVDMARRTAEEQALMQQLGLSSGAFASPENPFVETVSRVKLHLDGVRARVENMGYFFRYSGDWVGYEDEGIVSVDVGRLGVPHDGFGLDVEVELDAVNDQFERSSIPTIVVEGESVEEANLDVQRAVAGPGEMIGTARTLYSTLRAPAAPLFKVVNVQVEMQGVKVQMEKTRHRLLNTFLVQPLAGPLLARAIRQALEEKISVGLNRLSDSLGEVAEEAKRREKRRKRGRIDAYEMGSKSSRKVHDSLVETLGDWWLAILRTVPGMVSSGSGSDRDGSASRTILTGKGVIHESMGYDAGRMDSGGDGEETIVAVGVDAQLYPGKGDPEDVGVGTRPSLDELQEDVQACWTQQTERMEREPGKLSWRSSAFDF